MKIKKTYIYNSFLNYYRPGQKDKSYLNMAISRKEDKSSHIDCGIPEYLMNLKFHL